MTRRRARTRTRTRRAAAARRTRAGLSTRAAARSRSGRREASRSPAYSRLPALAPNPDPNLTLTLTLGLLACDYQHSHSRLRTLRLNGNDLTLSGFHALGVGLDAARTNNGLRLAELDLAHTGLCVEGLRGLLGPDTRGAHLASLRRLDLRQNMLDDDGARLLGRGFRSLQGLSHLFLRGNEFGCEGAAALFVGFAAWPTSEPPALQFCDALANHRLGVGAGRPAEGLAGCIDSVLAALSALPELTRLQLDPRLKRDDEAYNALQDACNRFDIDLHSF